MTILPISGASVGAIVIIIGILGIAFIKKFMMTQAIVIANFIVFILSIFYRVDILGTLDYMNFPGLSFRSMYLSTEFLPQIYTIFTSMFVHANFMHILGNMIVFLFIGMAFENRIGGKKFLMIYIATGVCGTLTYSLVNPSSDVPLVGASGAIFGILGAFAYAYPMDKVMMPIPIGIMFIARVRVITAAIIFALFETVVVLFVVEDNIAHAAHIGGLASGLILSALFIKKRPLAQPSKIGHKTDYTLLENLVKTEREKKILERVRVADVPEIRDAWLSLLLQDLRCPECGKKLHVNKDIVCKCGYKKHFIR